MEKLYVATTKGIRPAEVKIVSSSFECEDSEHTVWDKKTKGKYKIQMVVDVDWDNSENYERFPNADVMVAADGCMYEDIVGALNGVWEVNCWGCWKTPTLIAISKDKKALKKKAVDWFNAEIEKININIKAYKTKMLEYEKQKNEYIWEE